VLLLFDIDGTLVSRATEAHREALHAALRTVHGIDAESVRSPVSPAGRTDGEIARIILLDAGVSAKRIDERAAEVREECCRIYPRLVPEDLSHTVVPGVEPILDWLAARDDVRLGLLSGNYEPVARVKLDRAGVGHFFANRPGAFGSDSEDRADLPMIARRRAGSTGHPHPREHTIVIGDTPRDIACAHADELRCVAVATGPYSADELAQADAVARDAGELRMSLAALLER
jgi:phosphoglycolate phosphatase-like HAD superfamily hydrolase